MAKSSVDEATLARTRRALHVAAELLLAGPQYRVSGTIRLTLTQTGFCTLAEPHLAVDGVELTSPTLRAPINGRTVAELAEQFGLEAGAPGIYHDGTGATVEEKLELDAAAAAGMFQSLNVGAAGLALFAPDDESVLWPEHFDLGVVVEDTAYGVSPGDRHVGVPYCYVSAQAPDGDPYWNVSFGAARLVEEMGSAEKIKQFFTEGQRRLAVR